MTTQYGLLGMKVMKMIQNEKKCLQLRDYLSKNINVQEEMMDNEFNQVDEQRLQALEVKKVINNVCQNKYGNDKKQLLSKYNIRNNSKQVANNDKRYEQDKYGQKEIRQQNEFIEQIQYDKGSRCEQQQKNKQQKEQQYEGEQRRQVEQNEECYEIDDNKQIKQIVKKQRKQIMKKQRKYMQIVKKQRKQIYYNQRQQNEKQDDEYFQIIIRNKNTTENNKQQNQNLHQVKIYQSKQISYQQSHHHNNNQMFNLSNFSSFNGIISNQNNNNIINNNQNHYLQEEYQFYSQQFVYLIKKIQLTHNRKLSNKGIQSIANQLKYLFYQHTNQQLSTLSTTNISKPSINHIKDITSSNLNTNTNIKSQTNQNIKSELNKQLKSENKHLITSQNHKSLKQQTNKNKKLNCDSNLSTKFKYQTSQNKPKSKNKYQLPIQLQKKYQLNKENHKIQHQTKKHEIKKQHDRSTSPLSYRVLMEKKKTQQYKLKQSQINNYSQTVKQKNQHTSSIILSSSSFIKKAHDMNILNPYQSQKQQNTSFLVSQQKQKKNKLKIILENCSQQKMKTFSFQYVHNDKNLHQSIQEYCLKNKIHIKNIKLIQTALSHQKPIITIKQ